MAVDTVTSAPDGQRQTGLPREQDAGHDIRCARAAHDQPRPPVDHGVKDGTRLVVAVVIRLEKVACESAADDLDGGLVENRGGHGCLPCMCG
jgi:hypothetical protein